jgi:hypothetical protein
VKRGEERAKKNLDELSGELLALVRGKLVDDVSVLSERQNAANVLKMPQGGLNR